jgi:ribonuclease P protein component
LLPKPERLRKSATIQKTYAGTKISHPLFSIYALRRRPESRAYFPLTAFVVGKKVHLKANRRNLVKRRLREAYRLIRQDLPELKQWYSLVLVGRAKIVFAGWDEVKSNLQEAISCLNSKQGQTKC